MLKDMKMNGNSLLIKVVHRIEHKKNTIKKHKTHKTIQKHI